MKIIDLHNPERINRPPNKIKAIFSSGKFIYQGITVKKVELRLYVENTDDDLGKYSLITSFVDTDIGSIEMIYDEGFIGKNPLERAADFLTSALGISGLVLRSIIALKEHSKSDILKK